MSDLSFKTINDTDINELEAIQPMVLGDDAHPVNLNRPHENMRLRTERTRIAANENAYLLDEATVYRMYATANGTINWGGAWDGASPADPVTAVSPVGAFVPSQDINIVSLLSSGEARVFVPDELFYGGGTPFSSTFAYADFVQGAGSVRVVSKLHSHEGGDWITLEIVDGAVNLATPTVTVTGQAPLTGGLGFAPHRAHILVTLSDKTTDTNSIQDVMTALAGDPTASTILEMFDHPTLTSTLSDPAVAFAATTLQRGLNAVHMVVTPGTFAAFFGENDNRLREGDCLAINHADLTIRRGRISEKGTTNVTSGSIYNLSRNPEKAGGSIPICRVLNGELHLLSGAVIPTYVSGTLPQVVPHASNMKTPAVAKVVVALTTLNVEEQIDELATAIDGVLNGGFNPIRIGINQDPPNVATRIHVTDTGATPLVRFERTETAVGVSDGYGEIHAYGNDVGGTGVRASLGFISSGTDGETDTVFSGAGAGATLTELLRVSYGATKLTGSNALMATLQMENTSGGLADGTVIAQTEYIGNDPQHVGTVLRTRVDSDEDGYNAKFIVEVLGNSGDNTFRDALAVNYQYVEVTTELGLRTNRITPAAGDSDIELANIRSLTVNKHDGSGITLISEKTMTSYDEETVVALNDVFHNRYWRSSRSGLSGATIRQQVVSTGTTGRADLVWAFRDSDVATTLRETARFRSDGAFQLENENPLILVTRTDAGFGSTVVTEQNNRIEWTGAALVGGGIGFTTTWSSSTSSGQFSDVEHSLIDATVGAETSQVKWRLDNAGTPSDTMLLGGLGDLTVARVHTRGVPVALGKFTQDNGATVPTAACGGNYGFGAWVRTTNGQYVVTMSIAGVSGTDVDDIAVTAQIHDGVLSGGEVRVTAIDDAGTLKINVTTTIAGDTISDGLDFTISVQHLPTP